MNLIAGHSGDSGDTCYSLLALKRLSMATGRRVDLYLRPHCWVRDVISPGKAESLASLFRQQPYIASCQYGEPPRIEDLDLDRFRDGYVHQNLAEWQCRVAGVPFDQTEAWLSVADPVTIAPVVVARSPRYHNPEFPWRQVLESYCDRVVFVGSRTEHAAFQREFGHVDYFPTPSFLDLARVIAGSSLFIGNQSAPYAIAEGMKMPTIQETFEESANCIFERPGATFYRRGELVLPQLETHA